LWKLCYNKSVKRRGRRKEELKMLDHKKLYFRLMRNFELPKEFRLKKDLLPPNI